MAPVRKNPISNFLLIFLQAQKCFMPNIFKKY